MWRWAAAPTTWRRSGSRLATACILPVRPPAPTSGEYGLFAGERRTASLRAVGEARVLQLDYERFLLAFPAASLALLRQVIHTFT